MIRVLGIIVILVTCDSANLAYAARAKLLWVKTFPGLVTDIDFSSQGKKILLSTVPDPDRGGKATDRKLYLYSRKGSRLFEVLLKSPTRSQTISLSGESLAVSNYLSEISFYNSKGKELWNKEGLCRLMLWSDFMSCYHDDDGALKGPIFEVLSFNRETLGSFFNETTKKQVPLYLKISPQGQTVVLASSSGRLEGVNIKKPNIKFELTLSDEIVDLKFLDEENLVLLLTDLKQKMDVTQKSAFQRKIEIWKISPKPVRVSSDVFGGAMSALEPFLGGRAIGFYGTQKQGEFFGVLEFNQKKIKEVWRKEATVALDAESRMIGKKEGLWFVFGQSKIHRYGLKNSDPEIELIFHPQKTKFLTTFALDPEGQTLAAAFEDGRFRVYGVTE